MEARDAPFECSDWLQGQCLDKACCMKHPSRKQRQERDALLTLIDAHTSESEESLQTISDSDGSDNSIEDIQQKEVPVCNQKTATKGKPRDRPRRRRGNRPWVRRDKRTRTRLGSDTSSDLGVSSDTMGGTTLEPIGVFWDIENCSVPPNKSVLSCVNKIREEFFNGKFEAEFVCVCDINKERKEVIEQLNAAQVS